MNKVKKSIIFKLMIDKKLLQQPATKQDIARLRSGTKQDIARLRSGTRKDITTLRSETKQNITELQKEINIFKNEMLERFDGLAKLIKDQIEDFQLHNMTHRREQEQLDNHEERINHLEKTAPGQTGI